jgi:hypothetical protein
MSNPYAPYWLSNTLHFTYEGEELWGTIMAFGDGFFKLITKQGLKDYYHDKMVDCVVYQCCVSEFRKLYQYHGDERYKYLHDFYGPYVEPYPWKED